MKCRIHYLMNELKSGNENKTICIKLKLKSKSSANYTFLYTLLKLIVVVDVVNASLQQCIVIIHSAIFLLRRALLIQCVQKAKKYAFEEFEEEQNRYYFAYCSAKMPKKYVQTHTHMHIKHNCIVSTRNVSETQRSNE